mmetsp:Transcript_8460/g.20234  ORF Transcript_8460/g.20234 Transcript_8460/m.20234 type:complete len:724 (+) Transcript_8460:93-2264(+)|eukprot:CAMPEP_0201126456 /NCGR_PEP_ID=MMETSP0850-20130426/26148_1 /ASSEMBLY_ACC=CAM_ASM_000622 /TAXON_ID=183588 /ORGANISM="Pseudo-nitzschia fraudulenta, Strain WWA7" /LENGTH=723 /DNA_ID=CAMNT_0047394895 /DNA_START=82 /DNA_END=2253 /DNA_ORIENTATION=+
MDKNSVLASLTSDQFIGGNNDSSTAENAEQDLFGDIAIDEGPSSVVPPAPGSNVVTPLSQDSTFPIQEHAQVSIHTDPLAGRGEAVTGYAQAPLLNFVATPSEYSMKKNPPVDSLLSKSGLLGVSDAADDSGGLFDEVDKDDQKEAEKNMMNEQRIRQQEMEARQKEETEARRKVEEEKFRLQQQQQSLNNSYIQQDPVPVNVGNSIPNYNQQSAMMQSATMPQGQPNNQMSTMIVNPAEGSGFYREHVEPVYQGVQGVSIPSPNGNGAHIPQNNDGYYYGTREQKKFHPPQQQHSNNYAQPSSTAGMHNSMQKMNLGRIRKIALVKPQEVPPLYVDIRVTEPMLIQTQSFLISSPPYWSYQITSQLAGNLGTWLVRRRFRHVVALEDRLRQACPGSIIPPRPEKHAARALEEASTQQSAEFAVQRSKELEQYLNQLAKHPVGGQSQVFRLFLGLQDDIGTAWPEVSTNALTRLQAVGAGVTMRVAESTNLTAASAPAHEWEEDAELLGLCSSENLRLGAVSQAVPKLEGTVIVLREQGDAAGILGMELSKASKTLDLEYKFYDILSSGLLRHGRRTKRLALELSAAMESFLQQYKLVRYEKMAMHDRRQAIQRKAKERGRADARAIHLSQHQRHLQVNGQMHHLNQLEQSAISMDTHALDAVNEADEIGARLKLEINRVAIDRRIAWNNSIKTIASSMKDTCSERVAIWESTLEAFENLTKN